MFEKYYKQHLAKRLIQGRSVSDDAERAMLAKLKIECGSSFVSRMEGMLRDVKLSGEMATEYRKWVGRPGALVSHANCPWTRGLVFERRLDLT